MKKFLKWLLLLILAGAIAAGGWFFIDGVQRADEYEARQSLSSLVEQVKSQPDYVPYDQVASSLYQATIAIEDSRYYEHGGVEVRSLIRAAASQVLPFLARSGGSTIAMQVVKNLYQQFDGTPVWKAAEIVLATRLAKQYSKEEILALYVNIINYGAGFHGIHEASYGYYGISPAELSPAQATILAGIPQSPGYYQLSNHYEQAKAKQKLVLDAMVKNQMISQEEANAIYEQPNAPDYYYAMHGMAVLFTEANPASVFFWAARLLSRESAGFVRFFRERFGTVCALFRQKKVWDTMNRHFLEDL